MLEQTVTTLTDNGERVEVPVEQSESRFNIRSMMFVYLIYAVLVGSTEILGVGLLVGQQHAFRQCRMAALARQQKWPKPRCTCAGASYPWLWWLSAWPHGRLEHPTG